MVFFWFGRKKKVNKLSWHHPKSTDEIIVQKGHDQVSWLQIKKRILKFKLYQQFCYMKRKRHKNCPWSSSMDSFGKRRFATAYSNVYIMKAYRHFLNFCLKEGYICVPFFLLGDFHARKLCTPSLESEHKWNTFLCKTFVIFFQHMLPGNSGVELIYLPYQCIVLESPICLKVS